MWSTSWRPQSSSPCTTYGPEWTHCCCSFIFAVMNGATEIQTDLNWRISNLANLGCISMSSCWVFSLNLNKIVLLLVYCREHTATSGMHRASLERRRSTIVCGSQFYFALVRLNINVCAWFHGLIHNSWCYYSLRGRARFLKIPFFFQILGASIINMLCPQIIREVSFIYSKYMCSLGQTVCFCAALVRNSMTYTKSPHRCSSLPIF